MQIHRFLVIAALLSFLPPSFAADIAGSYSTNTTFANGDTWTGGDVTVSGNAVLNVPTGATLTFNSTGGSGGRNLAGTGSFVIDSGATFLLDTTSSNDNIVVAGAVAVTNAGTLQIDCGADFRLNHNSSSFTNTGLIWKTQATDGSANDPSYFFPAATSGGGKFVNESNIRVDAGHLNISGARTAGGAASSTGGTFTVASGAALSFSGGWTLLRGTSVITGSGVVALTNEDPAGTTGGLFVAMAPVTILDVGGDGLMWTTGILDPNGNTIRNDSRLRLTGTGATVTGTGSVQNGPSGTFELQNGTLTLSGNNFTNSGAMNLAGATTIAGTGSLINGATGVFRLTSGSLAANAAVINHGETILDSTGTITLSGASPFTNSATGTLTFSRGTLSLSGNNIVNNGLTRFNNSNNITLGSTGRFINNLAFNHIQNGGNDNLVMAGSAVFENNGTYDLQGGGDIQLTATGTFVNNGLLIKSVAGVDSSFVYGARGFTAAAGSEIRSTAGVLRLAAGGTSVAGATWTANGGSLDLAGEWSGTIQGSSLGASQVRILNSANAAVASDLLIGVGDLTLNISGNGVVWSAQIINTQGNTLRNSGLFGITVGGVKTLSGAGQFINVSGGTLNHTDGAITFADGSILRNQGQLNILTGSGSSSYDGTGSVINDSNGSINWSGGSLGIAPAVTFRNDGAFAITGAAARTLNGGGQLLNSASGTFTWGTASALTIDIGTTLRNEGAFDLSGTGGRTLGGAGQLFNAATGILHWNDGVSLTVNAGSTLRNDGTVNVSGTGSRTLGGAGVIVNNGTFDVNLTNSSSDNFSAITSGGQFTNNGLFLLREVADFEMRAGYTFTNSATGILRKTATTNLDQAQFFSFNTDTGAGAFDNQGTLEVLGGVFRITTGASGSTQFDNITLVQNDGAGTLTGGTWIANSLATGTAQIDLDPFGNTNGLTTIGQNALVELTGSGATLVQLASLNQVAGGLYINQKTFSAASGTLTIAATGTFGGNGTLTNAATVAGSVTPGESRGASIGTLTFNGPVLFQAGSSLLLQITAPTGAITGYPDPAALRTAVIGAAAQDPAAGAHDSLEIAGSLTLNPAMAVNVTSVAASLQYGQYFDLIDFSGLNVQGV
ncbi:MAG TPA: hypothetical protein VD994_18715, partial [Prosthecobacter sp.]|nr:hypothetical protein [Prosthecobacter sp.]